MTYYGQGLPDIARGLESIAKAIASISKVQSAPITYNIIVNVNPETEPEDVKEAVANAIQKVESKRQPARGNY